MSKAYDFLLKYRMTVDEIDDEFIISQYHKQMIKGLNGNPDSLAMIPTYINPDIKVIKNKQNIVIDAGGTSFRSGVAHFDDNYSCVISQVSKTFMPALEYELTSDEFFAQFANNIKSLLDCACDIGFCFSYAVNMKPNMDGTLLRFSKEIKAPQVIGKSVGQELLKAIKKYSNKDRKVVILNDTVSTLLGGKALTLNKKFDSYIGFVYGTGTNISYIENTSNIANIVTNSDKMIINMESGGFDKFTKGEFDIRVNVGTLDTNQYSFEKMTSGRYLGDIVFTALKQANDDKIFTANIDFDDKFAKQFYSLQQLSMLSEGQNCQLSNLFRNEQDKQLAIEIFQQLVLRSAKMCALALASVAKYKAQGKAGYNVGIVAEGTTFNKLYGYRQALEKYLNELLPDINYEIIQGQELNLIGTALASLAK